MKIHIVRPGETIFDLVQKYNIPYERLLEANPQIQLEELKAGQKVRVPSGKVWVSLPEQQNKQLEQENDRLEPENKENLVDAADQSQNQQVGFLDEENQDIFEKNEKVLLPTYMHPIELEVDDLTKHWQEEKEVDFSSSFDSAYDDSPFVPFFPLEAGNVYPQVRNIPFPPYPYEPVPYPAYPPPAPYFPPQNWNPAWNQMMLGTKLESSSVEY